MENLLEKTRKINRLLQKAAGNPVTSMKWPVFCAT